MRGVCLELSRSGTYTPIGYWAGMPLQKLLFWLDSVRKSSGKEGE